MIAINIAPGSLAKLLLVNNPVTDPIPLHLMQSMA